MAKDRAVQSDKVSIRLLEPVYDGKNRYEPGSIITTDREKLEMYFNKIQYEVIENGSIRHSQETL